MPRCDARSVWRRKRFVLRRIRGLDQRLSVLPQGNQNFADDPHLRDASVFSKVGPIDRTNELGAPPFTLFKTRHARGEQPISGKLARAPERKAELVAQPFHIAPHVTALRGIEIEGRIAPPLSRKYRTEEKWMPIHADPAPPRFGLYAGRSDVRIGTGEFKPELNGGTAHSIGSLALASFSWKAAGLHGIGRASKFL